MATAKIVPKTSSPAIGTGKLVPIPAPQGNKVNPRNLAGKKTRKITKKSGRKNA